MKSLSRREALKRGLLGIAGAASASSVARAATIDTSAHPDPHALMTGGIPTAAGIDPIKFLRTFDYGTVSRRPNGQTTREYQIIAMDRELEVMPGVFYPAWTFNGQIPGPTMRVATAEKVILRFGIDSMHYACPYSLLRQRLSPSCRALPKAAALSRFPPGA